ASLTAAVDQAWQIVLSAAEEADRVSDAAQPAAYAATDDGALRRVAGDSLEAVLRWEPQRGWSVLLPADDPRHTLLDLYLPICSATEVHPITVGHLGQSLDGFIATHAGESQYVTGGENIRHLHRLRALCDAVVVGAGTVAADDPQLTTRHVSGPSPVRVVLDPSRRLADHYRVFNDAAANTLYVCGKSVVREGDTHVGQAAVIAVDAEGDRLDVSAVLKVLRGRGCHRIFVEGGGVTVSMFLQANALGRPPIAIPPPPIGRRRPAVRLAP